MNGNSIHTESIVRFLQGKMSEAEQHAFEQRMQTEPEVRQEFEQWKKLWEKSTWTLEEVPLHVEQEWNRFKSRVDSPSRNFFWMYRVAAVVTLLLVAAAVWFQWYGKPETIVYQAPVDATVQFYLSDSSQVILDKNSRLELHSDYGENERKVQLSGRAYFQVKRDVSKTFTVIAGETMTQVLGTAFVVDASDSLEVEVLVESGKVAFQGRKNNQKVTLIKGQTASWYYGNRELSQDSIITNNLLSWHEHRLQFRNTPMPQVIRDLEEYFRVNIQMGGDRLSECRFTGSWNDPNLDEVLQVLETSLPIEFQKVNNEYIINGIGCHEK